MSEPGAVPSTAYTEEYFLSPACEGYAECAAGGISALKAKELELLGCRPGQRVLDLGCGRGEVAAELARRAARVVALDYADAAVRLARQALVGGAVVRADAGGLPFPAAVFDRVLLGDVVEHLPSGLALTALVETRRVLAPGGVALIHTAPNRWFSVGLLPVVKIAARLLGRRELAGRLDTYQRRRHELHPNELSPVSLRRLVRASGFEARTWVDRDVLRSGASVWTADVARQPVARVAGRLAGTWPMRLLLGNDLYAVCVPPPDSRR